MPQLVDVFVLCAVNAVVACVFRKADVMNVLESAGFSRSNPYYIVKQGKVWSGRWQCMLMSDDWAVKTACENDLDCVGCGIKLYSSSDSAY